MEGEGKERRMTLRRKKLKAFLERGREGERRETAGKETAKKYDQCKIAAHGPDKVTTPQTKNPQDHIRSGRERSEVED